jgi:hypothetical protein
LSAGGGSLYKSQVVWERVIEATNLSKFAERRRFIMAKVTVGHHPELTLEEAMKVFQRHFTGKYVVYMYKLLGIKRIVVKKSAWLGVIVVLKQKKGKTSFVFNYFTPSGLLRGLFFGLILILILRPRYEAMEDEVKSFLESAVEFK